MRRGLLAAGGGLVRLPRRIPFNAAMELALTGAPIEADRAAALGIVNVLTDPGAAADSALVSASKLPPTVPLPLLPPSGYLS